MPDNKAREFDKQTSFDESKHLIPQAYLRGFRDFVAGKQLPNGKIVLADNPYSLTSWFGKEWQRGFDASYFYRQKQLLNPDFKFYFRKKRK